MILDWTTITTESHLGNRSESYPTQRSFWITNLSTLKKSGCVVGGRFSPSPSISSVRDFWACSTLLEDPTTYICTSTTHHRVGVSRTFEPQDRGMGQDAWTSTPTNGHRKYYLVIYTQGTQDTRRDHLFNLDSSYSILGTNYHIYCRMMTPDRRLRPPTVEHPDSGVGYPRLRSIFHSLTFAYSPLSQLQVTSQQTTPF